MESSIERYQKAFIKYRVNPKSLLWQSKKAARQRYDQAVKEIDFEGKSVLDIGCGFGDIIPLIKRKSKHFKYEGIDVVSEFIREAKKLYPTTDFKCKDYFKNPGKRKYDVVICIGALNSNFKNNLDFRKNAIKTMFLHTKDTLVFTMAGSHPQKNTAKRSNVWFADTLEITKYCFTLTNKIILRSNYHSRDFTLIMYR